MILRAAALLSLALAVPARAEDRRFMLTGFDRIRVEGPFDVTVAAGAAAGAIATGERRALDSVTVRVQGTTLVVSPSINAWGGYPGAARVVPRIVVTATALHSATVNGGGRLTIDRMRGNRIDLMLTGAGTITVGDARGERVDTTLIGTGAVTIGGEAMGARFQSNGAGAIDAGGLTVGALSVNWQSAGDGRFAARDTAQVYAGGRGAITVAGDPVCTVTGGGPVVCGRR